jgi:hypothetical protein
MDASLPYVAAPGSIKTALEKIRQAATPDRVTRDFVTTKLSIKGGTGAALVPFFKKIGFVNPDGTPSELYKQFRNPASGGAAIAAAIKIGYQKLAQVNEYFYELNDKDLQSLIVQVTGAEPTSSSAKYTFASIKALKGFAKFDQSLNAPLEPEELDAEPAQSAIKQSQGHRENGIGLSLAYTINLNLPATADQAVFNAIFRSLKEHLLSHED